MEPIEVSRYRYSLMNPYAPPDRRYRLALKCCAKRVLPSFARNDRETWDLWKFLQNRQAADDPQQRVRLIMTDHALAIAFRLHHGSMRHLRPLIEAYLLSGADDNSIAQRVAAPPEAIRWFRLAFYDVQDQLHSPQYVRLHLIRVVDDEGQTTLDTHRLWKLLGYTLGPEALDELLGTSAAGKEAFKVGGLAGWFFQQTQDVLQSKQFVAASNLNPEDQKHVAPLLQLVLQGLRSQAKSDDRPLTSFEQIVNAMLQELPWCKGPELTPEPLRKWDERAAELRDEEMMLVAAGEELPAELKDVENLEFPFPRVKTPKGQPNASPGK